tara:strand:- start:140 stop:544 length:405 start_codon:yes stop_codon:yes gene_type:complete
MPESRLTFLRFSHLKKDTYKEDRRKGTVIRRVRKYNLYKCECGNEIVTREDSFKDGNTLSCGCLSRELSSEKMKRIVREGLNKSGGGKKGQKSPNKGKICIFDDPSKKIRGSNKGGRYVTPEELEEIWKNADAV